MLTREKDETLSVGKRTTKAHAEHADLFISLHANAGEKSCLGIETFYCDSSFLTMEMHHGGSEKKASTLSMKKKWGILSKDLATYIDSQIMSLVGSKTVSRGIKGGALQVLMGFQGPAVLIEAGYLTNPIESTLLKTDKYQFLLVDGICKGIKKFIEKHFA